MGQKKQIIQYKEGIEVAIYDSATEAAKESGTNKARISKCCKGILKQINGYTFKYTGEITNEILNNKPVKCPYCSQTFDSYNGLCKHIFSMKMHGNNITREQLLTDYKYNGERPTCKCGCGEYTTIIYTNGAHFSNYVIGHHNRVHNNWGHNKKAQEKSAETRRKQYESGERIQWNKGKKWEETFDEEKIKELLKVYKNTERNNKISKAFKGKPKSEEHAQKCRENGRSEKSININRRKMYERLTNGTFSVSSEIEKEFVENCIKPLGINFETQYYIKDIYHYCDVYIPSKNIIIEFQGDYWHGNPQKYTQEMLTEYQKKRIDKDNILRKYCKENGINLIEIWEYDYKKDIDSVTEKLEEICL